MSDQACHSLSNTLMLMFQSATDGTTDTTSPHQRQWTPMQEQLLGPPAVPGNLFLCVWHGQISTFTSRYMYVTVSNKNHILSIEINGNYVD